MRRAARGVPLWERASIALAVAGVTAAGIGTGAAQQSQQRPQAPVFRSGVEIVQLDVSVLDRDRRPVLGLTAADFTVFEDGRPRPVVAFSAFEMDDSRPATGWMREIPPDVTSNALTPDGRLIIIAIDDALIPQEPAFIKDARRIVTGIIDELAPSDMAAVVFVGKNTKAQDFTRDRRALLATLDEFNPGLASYNFGRDTNSVETDTWFFQSSVRVLEELALSLGAVPGRRKVLFWVSPGVPMDMMGAQPPRRYQTPFGDPRPGIVCLSACGTAMAVEGTRVPPPEMVDLLRRTGEIYLRAQRANVTIYPIDPTGLGGMTEWLKQRIGPGGEGFVRVKVTAQQDYLVAAAANTGGRALMHTNEFEPGIRDILAENSAYYLLGFEAASNVADGKLHRVEVKVDRPGVEVRTRSGYYAPAPPRPPDRRAAEVSAETRALGEAIGGLLPSPDLPMTVAVAPFAVSGDQQHTVTVVLGLRQPIPGTAAAGRVTETTELQVSAFTPEGQSRGTQRHTARLVLRPGATGEARFEVLGRIALPPGRYRLRLAAHNATSTRSGSVYADVTVPDYARLPVSAAPVVLSATPSQPSAPAGLLASVLPVVPTAERTFARDAQVTALWRLYQHGRQPIAPAEIAITVRAASDEVIYRDTQTVAADRFTSAGADLLARQEAPAVLPRALPGRPPTPAPTTSGDTFASLALRSADLRYPLPLALLTDGDYLLTLEATVGATTIRRDVRFSVDGGRRN